MYILGYFVDQKKGEVNELKQLLKNLNVERDVKRKRDIIKKVINIIINNYYF
jgi:hypothetical protein